MIPVSVSVRVQKQGVQTYCTYSLWRKQKFKLGS